MEICEEHGEDIAYMTGDIGSNCPVCDQIEKLEDHYKKIVARLKTKLEEARKK